MSGGLVGPLFSCIIRNQFERLLGGDRYFFTHSSGGCGAGEEGRGLETASKQSVLGRRLAHIICQNSHADTLQENVFRPVAETPALNPSRPCSNYPDLDWDAIVQDITGRIDSSLSTDISINGYIARVNTQVHFLATARTTAQQHLPPLSQHQTPVDPLLASRPLRLRRRTAPTKTTCR